MLRKFSEQEQPLLIIAGISCDVLSSSMQQKKMMNQFFPYIKLDYSSAIKTGKIVLLFNNSDDCWKVFTGWNPIFWGNSTEAVFNEASKKLFGIIKDVLIDFSNDVMEKI